MTSDAFTRRSVLELSRMRDDIKGELGIPAALDALVRLQDEGGCEDGAVDINIAICFYESGSFEAVIDILLPYLASDRQEEAFREFAPNAIEITLTSMLRCGRDRDVPRLLQSLLASDRVGRKRLLSYVAGLPLKADVFRLVWEGVLSGAGRIEIDHAAMRRLWDTCSTLSMASVADAVDRKIEERTPALELAARTRQLIHSSASRDDWRHFEAALGKDGWVEPYDAYRIGLNLLGSDMGDDAPAAMSALAQASPDCHALRRLLGVAHERRGHRDRAIELYRSAAEGELRSRGLDITTFPRRHTRDIRVSCIALSYNDQPLVRHFCNMVKSHCDELIVNDGGSEDGTIEAFERFGADHGFPVLVMKDQQHQNRARTLSNKDGYRKSGWGGVVGFDADRRRTLTLVEARYEYILMLDLDDYLPPFVNVKSLIAASYGIEHFCGARLEVLGQGIYTTLRLGAEQAAPTLFKRDKHHVYAGVDSQDEYLALANRDLAVWAMKGCKEFLSDCFCYWHLKYGLDDSNLATVRAAMGAAYNLSARYDRPLLSALSHVMTLV